MLSRESHSSDLLANEALQKIAALVNAQAKHSSGNMEELLALLRALEVLHREIRDNLFQDALPNNRQALHRLLREMESEGGWPYIPRMRLQTILQQLETTPSPSQPPVD
ncbi:MAG: hypothetical protein WA902_16810 [Thermosynechococcaceae cyanobacterium]